MKHKLSETWHQFRDWMHGRGRNIIILAVIVGASMHDRKLLLRMAWRRSVLSTVRCGANNDTDSGAAGSDDRGRGFPAGGAERDTDRKC